MTLKGEQLAYWDAARKGFTVEGDRVELMVGASSADIRARRVIKVTR
jgi:hypothetical protein